MNKGRRGRKHTNSSGSFRWLLALAALVSVVYFGRRGFDARDTTSSVGTVTQTSQNAVRGDFEVMTEEDVKEVIQEKSKETAEFESTENDAGSAGGDVSIKNEHDEKDVKERAKAAILGAFVADAASMGLHWIYSTKEIQKLLEDKKRDLAPEFFEPPSCPFYKYDSGSLSPYGDEALPLLESMVDEGGIVPLALSKYLYNHFKGYKGRLNSASEQLIRNIDAGKQFPNAGPKDSQAHGLVKVPVVVGRYAGLSNMKEKMLQAIKVHQDHPAVDATGVAAALVLERVILGDTIQSSINWALEQNHIPSDAREWLDPVMKGNFSSAIAAIENFGQSCHLPGSFQGPFYIAVHSSSYMDAVRENIMSGGDNCSRAHLIGALFAAQDGLDSVPEEWRKKTNMYTDLEHLVDDLLERRGAKQ